MDLVKHLKVRNIWENASKDFNFKFISPFEINIGNSNIITIFGHISGYGSVNGTLIEIISPPEFNIDKRISEYAKENNFYYSFINEEFFKFYDYDYFKGILDDWGKY